MITRKVIFTILVLLFLLGSIRPPILSSNGGLANAQSEITPTIPIELGYSPSSLTSIQSGTPVYAPSDTMWLFSGASTTLSIQLITPTGKVAASKAISSETASSIYKFSTSDPEGGWTIEITPENSPFALASIVQFVNPSLHQTSAQMSNFSLQSGQLNLGFTILESGTYDLEACLASTNMNSTVVLPIPASIGKGQMMLNGNLHNATVSIKGATTETFSFWYELDYSYSYSGNVSGELISRDVTAVSSNSALFTSVAPENVTLTNATTPRPGRYDLNAYFSDSSGLTIEQTRVLVLNNGTLLWIGGCSPVQVTGSSLVTTSDLTRGPKTWPTTLYLMYETQGVDSYSALPLGLNETRIHFAGSLGNTTLPYLGFSVNANANVLATDTYDGVLYVVAKDFPLTLQITPSFGSTDLPMQSITISKPFSDNQFQIPVSVLSVQVTNDSAPLVGASITVNNGFGGETTSTSGLAGRVIIDLPAGQYNVTATSMGQSISKNVVLATNSQSTLQFPFVTKPSTGYFQYLLVSLLIIGLVLNVWLWIIRPRRS